MKKHFLYILLLSFLFYGCEMEEGKLYEESPSSPIYSSSPIKKLWGFQVNFLDEENDEKVENCLLVDDLVIVFTDIHLYAYSAINGRLRWSVEKPPNFFGFYNATKIDGKIFLVPRLFCNRAIVLVLNKENGDFENQIRLDWLPGVVEGECSEIFLSNGKIYLSVNIPKGSDSDFSNYSFAIYEYDLATENINLVFFDESSYFKGGLNSYFSDEKGKAVYIPYFTYDSINFLINIVKIPRNGTEGEVIFTKNLGSSTRVPSNSFVVKDNIVVSNFHKNDETSIKAYDIDNEGEIIWFEEVPPGFVLLNGYTPIIQFDKLILVGADGKTIERRDFHTGELLWRQVNDNFVDFASFESHQLSYLTFAPLRDKITIVDINSGSYLINIKPSHVGAGKYIGFITAHFYDNAEKIILLNQNGILACLELPF